MWRRSVDIGADSYRANRLDLPANHLGGMMHSPRLIGLRQKAGPRASQENGAAGMSRRRHRARLEGLHPIGVRWDRRPPGVAPGMSLAYLTGAELTKEYTRFGNSAVLFLYFQRMVPPQSASIGHWKLQGIRAPCCGLAPGRGARGSTPTPNCNQRPELRS